MESGTIKSKMKIIEALKTKVMNMRERALIIICASFIWGIFAHGIMIFNKFSFHDDIAVFFGTNGSVVSESQ